MNNIISKNLYKIFLTVVKYIPTVLAIGHIISLCLNYCGIHTIVLSGLIGTSGMFIGLLWILSYVFKFCYLYRIPLWYSTIIVISFILRSVGLLLIDLENLYRMYVGITGLFGILFIYFKYKNRNKPKVDYIKQLCERYCNC